MTTEVKADDWFVVRTGVRLEEKAASALRRSGYRVYVPKLRKDIQHHRTKKWVAKRFILLNRYIFVRMTRISTDGRPDWFTLKSCDGVAGALGIDGAPATIARSLVRQFMLAQRGHDFDSLHVEIDSGRKKAALARSRFRRDQQVRVLSGPFSGFVGDIVSVNGRGVIKIALSMFGQLTPMEFEDMEALAVDETSEAA